MFKRIYLEISNICNVQCSFCPVVKRDNNISSINQIRETLKKISPYTEEVCLHLMGEPTAHPEFETVLEVASELNIKLNITTNGLLIKRKNDSLIASKSIRQINFSLQSFTDNFPEKPLESYLNPIFKFTKEILDSRDDVYINYRLWNIGKSATENDKILNLIESYFEAKVNRSVDVGKRKSKRVWKKLYLHFDSRFEWPSLDLKEMNTSGRCHGLKSHIGIHTDGTVVPCCLDSEAVIKLGNINDMELDEVLNSDLAVKMKNGFEKNELVHDLCKRCGYIQRFNKKGKNVSN